MKFCYVDLRVKALYALICAVYAFGWFGVNANPFKAQEQTVAVTKQGLNFTTMLGLLFLRRWTHAKCGSAKTMYVAWGALGTLGLSMLVRSILGATKSDERFTPWDTSLSLASTLFVMAELVFVFVPATPLTVAIFVAALVFAVPGIKAVARLLSSSRVRPDERVLRESLEASQKAYRSFDIEDPSTNTQVALVEMQDVLYVAFRGTENKADVKSDVKIGMRTVSWLPTDAKAHRGFLKAYESVRDQVTRRIREALDTNRGVKKLVFTGHSLGGALATLAAADWVVHGANVPTDVYTFGAPQVGDQAFVNAFDAGVGVSVRVVNPHDKVPASLAPVYVHVKGYYPVTTVTKDVFPVSHLLSSYRLAITRNRAISIVGSLAPSAYVAIGATGAYALRRFVFPGVVRRLRR